MNVLVFAPYAINTPHFETELELAQNHLDAGDRVTMLVCNGDLSACDVNMEHRLFVCLRCVGRRLDGVRRLSGSITVNPLLCLNADDRREIARISSRHFTTEDLKGLRVEEFDLGYGVLSSLISALREPEVDLRKHQRLARNFVASALAVFRSVQHHIASCRPDRTYLYNGRYAPMRAAYRACQSRQLTALLHEKASTIHHYALFEDFFLDSGYVSRMARHAWDSSPDPSIRDRVAAEFFTDPCRGVSKTWIPFTTDQQPELLPNGWDCSKINIAIFGSSEDEFAALGDASKHPVFASQYGVILRILKTVGGDERLRLYLRLHPNLKHVRNSQTKEIQSLSAANLTVIPPDSPISTYALLRHASKVLTFGSTTGIEAVYWGIPSILAGQALYRDLGCTYNPETHDELIQMLYAPLSPKDREGALMYGYFFNSYGIPFRHYQADGIYEGRFNGVPVKESILLWGLSRGLQCVPPLNTLMDRLHQKRTNHHLGVAQKESD